MTIPFDRLRRAYETARNTLLAERTPEGFWIGHLSSSALSTATAIAALQLARPNDPRISKGLQWLAENQNADGGWGDTVKSFSNISTTMLCRAAFHLADNVPNYSDASSRCEVWLTERYGRKPQELAEAIRDRYGKDRTFAVPILTMSAIAGLVPWKEAPRLPYELACLPQSWYRFVRLPVVSYALPALIAIGQCVHFHRGTWNPLTKLLRTLGKQQSLRVLQRIQPASGGYLEATPLTSFVVMSLASIKGSPTAQRIIDKGVDFLLDSARSDGSWPIDSNLSIWVTTLSINALAAAGDLESLDSKKAVADWLISQQLAERHPYTGADSGAWGWSHLSGSVPDCDDTPGALLALDHIAEDGPTKADLSARGASWVSNLQNRDGGWPTFCKGWGMLPFDRSGSDLTAHALRALSVLTKNAHGSIIRGLDYLARHQLPDGSWLPLWFGNQHAGEEINATYGTAKVLAAYRDLNLFQADPAKKGVEFLLSIQNVDGGWGGVRDTPSSVEETALAVEVLLGFGKKTQSATERGIEYLVRRVEAGTFTDAAPIGFYFAKLWYFEKLYPIIFTVAALGRALRESRSC